jgi:hypothetical protein
VNALGGLALLAAIVVGYLLLQWVASFLSDAASTGLDKLARPERRKRELGLARSEVAFSAPCTASRLFDEIVAATEAKDVAPALVGALVVAKRTERMLQIDLGNKLHTAFISTVRIAEDGDEACAGRFGFEHWKVEDNGRPRNVEAMQRLRDTVQRVIERLGGDAQVQATEREVKRKRPLV